MGFMDKAKKLAEQAQAKLDEVQKSVNTTQGGPPAGGAPVVEYDKHGRPVQTAPVPDPGAPPMATPGVPQTEPPASTAPPAAPASTGPTPDRSAPEDRNRPSTEPPKLSSGDPLAG